MDRRSFVCCGGGPCACVRVRHPLNYLYFMTVQMMHNLERTKFMNSQYIYSRRVDNDYVLRTHNACRKLEWIVVDGHDARYSQLELVGHIPRGDALTAHIHGPI